jgi:hypothetical protein
MLVNFFRSYGCSGMAEAKRLHTPEGTPPSHRTLVAPHHAQGVLHTLLCLYQCEDLCDYSIMAEGQAFRVHRNVLAAVSDYFRVMLTGMYTWQL